MENEENIIEQVNNILNAHHERMTVWERQITTNLNNTLQSSLPALLEQFSPKPEPLWKILLVTCIQAAMFASVLGVTLTLFGK